MTIDERLDRLTERHEALTQTVEHMALQGEEHRQLVGLMETFPNIVKGHARRLSGLEGWS